MSPKTKAPPEPPGAGLRQRLSDARDTAARLEADNVAAVQDEEQALERGDTSSIVAARGRAMASADALIRQREKIATLEAQLATIDDAEAARAGKARLVQLTKTAAVKRAEYESLLAEAAARAEQDARALFAVSDSYFGLVRSAEAEASHLGVELREGGTWNGFPERRARRDALLAELSEQGAEIEHLRFVPNARTPDGWRYQLPEALGLGESLGKAVGELAYRHAVAADRAAKETASVA